MGIVLILVVVLVLLFGFVVFFGAPYLPTFRKQTETALDLLKLKPGQTLLELGCGDGRVLKIAATRGLKVVGYELNPVLAITARLNTWRYRRQVRIVWGNFWYAKWPETEGIFVFLLDKYMEKLDKKIIQETENYRPVRLVSYAFKIPNRKPVKTKGGLYLYEYR
jgi:SAM-dependent methyltransferase